MKLTREQLSGEGVVGAINRLGRCPIFRRYADGQISYSKDDHWEKVEGNAFVVISDADVANKVNIHVFDAAGNTFLAFSADVYGSF